MAPQNYTLRDPSAPGSMSIAPTENVFKTRCFFNAFRTMPRRNGMRGAFEIYDL